MKTTIITHDFLNLHAGKAEIATITPTAAAVKPIKQELEDENAPSPGPWQTDWNAREFRWQLRGPEGTFGHFCGWSADGVTTEGEDEANAALIARAPELLAENAKLRAALADIVALDDETIDAERGRYAAGKRSYSFRRIARAALNITTTQQR